MPLTWRSLVKWMLGKLALKAGSTQRPKHKAWASSIVRHIGNYKRAQASRYLRALQGYYYLPRPGKAGAKVSTGGAHSSCGNLPSGQHPDSKGDSAKHSNHREERSNYLVVASFTCRIHPRIIFNNKKITE